MNYRRDNDLSLLHLVKEYEQLSDEGIKPKMDEHSFEKLINYYEKELLFDKALEVLNYAIENFSFSATFHLRKANLLLLTRNSEMAMSTLNVAQDIAPQEKSIQLLKARILAAMEKHSEALQVVNDIKENSTESEKSQAFYTESLVYELMRDYNKMYEVLEIALLLDPNNESALQKLWICTELTRKFENCRDFHLKLIDHDPYNAMAWYNLGQANACMGEYSTAISAYEYAFLIKPDFEEAYIDCAELHLETGDIHTALKVYLEQLQHFGPDSELYGKIGHCYLQLNQLGKAKKYLIRSHKLDPYNDEIIYYLSDTYYKLQKYNRALKLALEALNIEDRNEEYYHLLGKIFDKLEQPVKAEYYLRKATEIGPDQIHVWTTYVMFLLSIEQRELAMYVIDQGIENVMESDLLIIKIALSYQDGKKKEATKELIEILEDGEEVDFKILFHVCPEMEKNKKIQKIIEYYSY